MVHVLLTLLFHSKIVNNKGEGDGTHHVFPETQGILKLVITMGGKTLAKDLAGEDAGLWQSPDGISHLEVDVAFNDYHLKAVLGDDPRREQADGHLHVFVPI